jgi:hypothetical protein
VWFLCVCCVVWVLIPFYYLLNIMMRSSRAFSRKKAATGALTRRINNTRSYRCLAIINYLIIKYCVQSPCLPVPDSTCVASYILFYLQCVSLCFCPLIVACQLQVLAEDIPTIVSGISFPKSMRWNSNVCVP